MALALRHSDWVLGFQDEVWWSRLAQPNLQTWTEDKPLRLLQNEPDRHDPEPKAVACYGLLRTDTQSMLLRFVDGRPVSAVTTQFLAWLTAQLAVEGKTALLMVWDNASWHVSQAVRAWLKMHNRRVKQEGGCRIAVCPLPIKSPWLNRIEPKWVHGKRAIAEPDRKLSVEELKHRICTYYACEQLEPITQKVV
jgi:transposase